ncbi:MAG: hypothetical protein QHH75_13240 [Bacillota bacterium]|nr:hypothetical protein [Bacillota bacterium]
MRIYKGYQTSVSFAPSLLSGHVSRPAWTNADVFSAMRKSTRLVSIQTWLITQMKKIFEAQTT